MSNTPQPRFVRTTGGLLQSTQRTVYRSDFDNAIARVEAMYGVDSPVADRLGITQLKKRMYPNGRTAQAVQAIHAQDDAHKAKMLPIWEAKTQDLQALQRDWDGHR